MFGFVLLCVCALFFNVVLDCFRLLVLQVVLLGSSCSSVWCRFLQVVSICSDCFLVVLELSKLFQIALDCFQLSLDGVRFLKSITLFGIVFNGFRFVSGCFRFVFEFCVGC